MKLSKLSLGAAVLTVSAMMAANASASLVSVIGCDDIRDPNASITIHIPTIDPAVVDPATISSVTVDFSNLVITGEIYAAMTPKRPTTFDASLGIYSLQVFSESNELLGNINFNRPGKPDDISAHYTATTSTLPGTTIVGGTWEGSNSATMDWASFMSTFKPGSDVTFYLMIDQMNYNGAGSSLINWKANLSGSVDVTYTTVPELATFGVLGLGSVALMLLRRK